MPGEVYGPPVHASTVLLSPNASPDPKAADSHVPPAMTDDEAHSLARLLLQASDTIRAERARADAMEYRSSVLDARLDGVRAAYHRATAQRRLPYQSVAKQQDASDELFRYIKKHIIQEETTASPRVASRDEHPPLQRSSSRTTPTTHAGSSSVSVRRVHSRGSVTATTQSYRKGWKAIAATSLPAEASTEEWPTPASPLTTHQDPTAAKPATLLQPSGSTPSIERESIERPPQQRSTPSRSSVQAMACRLRRAIAQRPAEMVMGDIIHTMVTALQRDAQAKLEEQYLASPASPLRGFALVQIRPCVYQVITGPPADVKAISHRPTKGNATALQGGTSPPTVTHHRNHYLLYNTTRETQQRNSSPATLRSRAHTAVVHLTVHSGTLCIMRGGGNVDFVEYLERLLHIHLA
ncbi:hypothetical protein ABL78_6286 [Leptomonas seymouri]|uniref:Uncharacterized protein n=1 Tax=Leptomonas seymouri TaxID=5684 RepID=A0A0N1HVL6_LEPSE|nr:hypothetical protein ABL78_6286 [Leptomonas seymouri]|eukprot:KPI84645.1 hypothetical protein ABL78_6286 [Leptomonas seymouri]